MRVSVFGLGYVGTVTAAWLAKAGHHVVAVDIQADKVRMINDGKAPVLEPGLPRLIAEVHAAGHLRATTSSEDAIAHSELALLCVGTPSMGNGKLDVDPVMRVGREIGAALRYREGGYTVVLRSTVLPGTTVKVLVPALLEGAHRTSWPELRIAVNPEFMREGTSLKDLAHPPYTLVGCRDAETAAQVRALYASVDAPFIHTEVRSAEMVKYVSNTFHALKICFANEIGDLCESLGADAREVMRIFCMDHKLNISEAYLRPGFAFGGSCLPKDVRALVHAARGADLDPPLLSSIVPSNEKQVQRAVTQVLATQKRRIGVAGLAFKADTDDLREGPLVELVESLLGKGREVRVLDWNIALTHLVGANRRYIEERIPHIASLLCTDVETLVGHAEVLVLGNPGAEAELVRAAAREDQIIIDLTRGGVARPFGGNGEGAAK